MGLRIRLADGAEDLYTDSREVKYTAGGELTTEVKFTFEINDRDGLTILRLYRSHYPEDSTWKENSPQNAAYYRPERWVDVTPC